MGSFFEDIPELLLEYYWVEKYLTTNLPWYLICKDLIVGCIALYTCISKIKVYKAFYHIKNKSCKEKILFTLLYCVAPLLFSIASFLRVYGAIHQYMVRVQGVTKIMFYGKR